MKRFTAELLDEVAAMRERGLTYHQIGRKFGISGNAISWYCLKLGAEPPRTLRSWDGIKGPLVTQRNGHAVRRFTPEDDAQLLALEAMGLSISQIARQIGRRWNSTRARLMTLARRDERREASL